MFDSIQQNAPAVPKQRNAGRELLIDIGWLTVGQAISAICQGAYFVLLARLLGLTEYGIYVGAMALVSIVSQYSALGSHSVFLRYVSAKPELFPEYWGNVLLTTGCLGLIFAGLLAVAARSFPTPTRLRLCCALPSAMDYLLRLRWLQAECFRHLSVCRLPRLSACFRIFCACSQLHLWYCWFIERAPRTGPGRFWRFPRLLQSWPFHWYP